MAWYNDYRPSNFDEVVGQKMIKTVLQNTIEQSKLPEGKSKIKHGYLLSGPKGVGKTTIARIFANGLNDVANNPQATLDIVELDAASQTGVDNIRQLIDSTNTPPFAGKYKIFIIDEVHMLSKSAMSALLKTLEEPPSYLIFLFATTNPEKLIPTVLSRLTKLALSSHTIEDIVAQLSMIATKEKLIIDNDSLNLIAKRSSGGQRDAINLLETLSSYNLEKYTIQDTSKLLGLVNSQIFDNISTMLLNKDFGTISGMIQEVENLGLDGEAFLAQFLDYLLEQVFTNPNQSQSLIMPVASILNMKLPINTVLASFALVQAELTKNTFVRTLPPQTISSQNLSQNQNPEIKLDLTEKKSPKIELTPAVISGNPQIDMEFQPKIASDKHLTIEEFLSKPDQSPSKESTEESIEGQAVAEFDSYGFIENNFGSLEEVTEVPKTTSSTPSIEKQYEDQLGDQPSSTNPQIAIETLTKVTIPLQKDSETFTDTKTTTLDFVDPVQIKSLLPSLTKLPTCPPTMKMLINDINVESTDNNKIILSISSPIFLPQLKNPKAIDFLTQEFGSRLKSSISVDVILRDPSLKNPAQKAIKQPELSSSFGTKDNSGQNSKNLSESNSESKNNFSSKEVFKESTKQESKSSPDSTSTKPTEIFYKIYGDSMPDNTISDVSKMKFFTDKIEFPIITPEEQNPTDWNDEIGNVFDF